MRLPDGRVARYRYDAFARRVSRELIPKERTEFATALAIAAEKGPEALPPVERTEFLWDGDVLCEERSLAVPVARPASSDEEVHDPPPDGEAAAPAPAYKRVFVHEPDTFLPMLQQEGGKTYAYVLDHLGTPKELIDERGRVAWSAAYSAWGRIVETARDRGTVQVESPFRLLGQYEDQETGLRYTRYRYFEAETGRWLSPDPLGAFGSANLLGFDGNPTGTTDPFGLLCKAGIAKKLRALAKQARQELLSDPDLLRALLTEKQRRILETKPYLARALFGSALETRVARLAQDDLDLAGVTHVGQRQGSKGGPDFVTSSGASFDVTTTKGIPSSLIRRDPASQAIITRRAVLAHPDWRSVADRGSRLVIADMLRGNAEDAVFVAALQSRDAEKDLEVIARLRDAGIAEPD